MAFEPILYRALTDPSPRINGFGAVVQLSLIPEFQSPKPFVVRLHHASRRHYDLRFQVLNALLSFALDDVPCLDPAKATRALLMPDHNPANILSERVIPVGRPGAGPTMPVDYGTFAPIAPRGKTFDMEMLEQLSKGELRLRLDGARLRGDWQIRRTGHRSWELRKLADAFASATSMPALDRSILTGRFIHEIV